MATQNILRNNIADHFRKHGETHPVRYLAHEIGVSTVTINTWINASASGIGFDRGQLNPYSADHIIAASIKVMDNPRSRNPVRRYLNSLRKDYERVRRERFDA